MILTEAQVTTIEHRNAAHILNKPHPAKAHRDDIPDLVASHRELASQLAAATKRADDAERERDAALDVLLTVQWGGEADTCPECGWEKGEHWDMCALAACLKGGV